jgi:hypothetical protein
LYDVQLDDESDKVISNVPTKGLRRKYRRGTSSDNNEMSILPAQTRVTALYRDDDGNAVDYFPGQIVRYDANRKSYHIEFDDGDVAYNVGRHDIELMVQSEN